ncbi:MAG TPA: hypothetical protein VK988_07580 [Acidimicrobiales bacterium]|nr:hypothetical protein [Acidimicrobiales bacterium]
MSPHIIGRPNDDLLDLILGPGADPEQAFIGGWEQGLEEGDKDPPSRRRAEPSAELPDGE